jgi:hypothetical protein
MSDFTGKFQALADAVGGIAQTLDARRRVQIPSEPHDRSLEALRDKVNEILRYLEDLSRILPNTTPDQAAIAEIGQDLDRALPASPGAPGYAAAGQMIPGQQTPGGFGQENLRQRPAVKHGQIVECYDDQGAVWEKPRDGLYGSSFAKYAKLHPCSRAWDYHLGVVLYVDATKDVYIEFPNINPGGDARLKERPWPASVTGHDEEQATGVGYCPAGTIVAYHEYPDAQDDPTSGPITFKVTGIEAGWIRQLPWVLERGRSRAGVLPTAGFEAGYGEDVPIVMRLASAEGGVTIYGREHAIFDACGRMIAMGVEDALGSISGHVHADVEGVLTQVPVHFA